MGGFPPADSGDHDVPCTTGSLHQYYMGETV